jgi:hypothetical protein
MPPIPSVCKLDVRRSIESLENPALFSLVAQAEALHRRSEASKSGAKIGSARRDRSLDIISSEEAKNRLRNAAEFIAKTGLQEGPE